MVKNSLVAISFSSGRRKPTLERGGVMVWLFLDGTLFWVFALIVSVSLFGAVQSDKPGWCSFILGAFVVCLQLFSPYHPLTYIVHNTVDTLALIAGYAFAGTIWCVVKWMSYVHLLKDKYIDYRNRYIGENPQKTRDQYIAEYKTANPINTKDGRQPWTEPAPEPNPQQIALQQSRAEEYADRKLEAPDDNATSNLGMKLPKTEQERMSFLAKHKSVIYMWIMFWPFSLIGTIFDDPVRRFCRFVYNRLTGMLSGITARAFKNI
jgi:hypothetical protein